MVDTLAAVLEAEHREIGWGIEIFAAGCSAGDRDPEPLRRAVSALRRHIYVEEQRLFPLLRQQELFAALMVMLREHGRNLGHPRRNRAGTDRRRRADAVPVPPVAGPAAAPQLQEGAHRLSAGRRGARAAPGCRTRNVPARRRGAGWLDLRGGEPDALNVRALGTAHWGRRAGPHR